MMNLLCAGMTMVLVVLGFHNSYCISGVHSAYLGLYKGIVEECVIVADADGNYLDAPQFHVPRLRNLLKDYYATNLAPYCRSYTFDITKRDPASNLFPTYASRHIELSFRAVINDLHTIEKKASFQIWRTSNG